MPAPYIKHGMTKHPLYLCYHRLKGRCNNKNSDDYRHYGGRGIVCEWKTFLEFFNDMKDSFVPGLEIDRIDVNGNYSKENCRWATRKEQMNNYRGNRIIEFEGKKYTQAQLIEIFPNINSSTIKRRILTGKTIEQILSITPINKAKRIAGADSVSERAKKMGISDVALRYRIKKFGLELALTKPVDKFKGVQQPSIFIEYKGIKYTLRQLSVKYHIRYDTLYNRIFKHKWPVERAVETTCKKEKPNFKQP